MTSSNGNVFRVAGPLCGEGQWRGALMFSLICAWTNGLVNKGDADDLRRHRAHYDVTVMYQTILRCTLIVITHMFFFKFFITFSLEQELTCHWLIVYINSCIRWNTIKVGVGYLWQRGANPLGRVYVESVPALYNRHFMVKNPSHIPVRKVYFKKTDYQLIINQVLSVELYTNILCINLLMFYLLAVFLHQYVLDVLFDLCTKWHACCTLPVANIYQLQHPGQSVGTWLEIKYAKTVSTSNINVMRKL